MKKYPVYLIFLLTVNCLIGQNLQKLKKKAENGNAKSQYELFSKYLNEFNDKTTTEEKSKAFYWLMKSAEKGYALAQLRLGIFRKYGEHLLTDHKKAFNWFKKSAKQGNYYAQFYLGEMYLTGKGTLTDKKKAFYWMKKSSEQGFDGAQYSLGLMHFKGEGTLVDKKKAAFWIRKSYQNGSNEAKEIWDKLELYKY